ncbi:hypothetical protein GCM10010399_20840 [Dactylosporangium fulvum]|uniref:GNAT family N-acetyltransferase n=1 Tax=Dactylosporangium fulvum TaxID=53359 RepID=A0ABY5W475_9ACTN|nr:GNAT family N-acetyltransferase [Dactylosporangium fulvum]UWP84775.1 GNAT family N-acetyltransferase [Dactylosporangium fulvum]
MELVRRAGADDAEELVRLRAVMLASIIGERPKPGEWVARAAESLRRRLPEPDARIAAFVVDDPDGGLAACAVGVVEERLAGPDSPSGLNGYVFNVVTDPRWRRRGFSRACMTALIAWFADHGVRLVDLRASDEGLPLYTKLGFELQHGPAMRLRLP